MLDHASSRRIVVAQAIEERQAEARRAHLLRTSPDDREGAPALDRVPAGVAIVDRILAALGRLTPVARRPAFR